VSEDNIVWKSVLSSRVSRVGYDSETQELFVEWAKGKMSVYEGVPADVADDFSKSWSVGSAVNDLLSGYPMRYL
jgi:hypothetical protein